MSSELVSHSADLARLADEGYELEVTANNYLLIHNVPYVAGPGRVERGTLVSALDIRDDRVVKPGHHEAFWSGEFPCDASGSKLQHIVIDEGANLEVRKGLVARFKMSQKPPDGYADYYEKMTAYVLIIQAGAKAINPELSAFTRVPIVVAESNSVFLYRDTASTRAGISHISDRLAGGKVAIIGLGGTGSYVLDFLAKTAVAEIHLFDHDTFEQHNAFRTPGAASLDELRRRQTKLQRLGEIYGRMRSGIVPHEEFVTSDNLQELVPMEFVFICIDNAIAKGPIIRSLRERRAPFVDVGMGLGIEGGALDGQVRTTAFLNGDDSQLPQIPIGGDGDDPYTENIQIAELNALNAALAVIRWKRFKGFYARSEGELQSVFWVSQNMLVNYGAPNEETADSG